MWDNLIPYFKLFPVITYFPLPLMKMGIVPARQKKVYLKYLARMRRQKMKK